MSRQQEVQYQKKDLSDFIGKMCVSFLILLLCMTFVVRRLIRIKILKY